MVSLDRVTSEKSILEKNQGRLEFLAAVYQERQAQSARSLSPEQYALIRKTITDLQQDRILDYEGCFAVLTIIKGKEETTIPIKESKLRFTSEEYAQDYQARLAKMNISTRIKEY